jgi:putative zinc finger/helix-turn-helix YgiT family protein
MKCPNCKTEMICGPGKHHYKESGLDNVYLLGIDVCQCPCGEKVVTIPAVTELHSKIALVLIKKKSLLGAKEIRFLRKSIGLTATKLGEIMGVDNATISRWENDKQRINEARDRLLRLIFLNVKGISTEEIKHLIEEDFADILPEFKSTPPYMIPVDEWSKTSICLAT